MDPKQSVAQYAVHAYVRDGMTVALGTGRTATFLVERIGEQVASGALRDLKFVCTSQDTERKAKAAGLPLIELGEDTVIDLAIDGADEIDPAGNIVKGRGGALYREKFLELIARKFVVIADSTKLVEKLAHNATLPVEIGRWNAAIVLRRLRETAAQFTSGGVEARLREGADGSPFVTDNQNFTADLVFAEGVADPAALHRALKALNGVVETGLFVDMNPEVVVADAQTAQCRVVFQSKDE